MVDQRFDHIDSGKFDSIALRAYLRWPSVTCTQLPKTPPIAHSRVVSDAPSSTGTSDAPCVRYAGESAPNTSRSVAWMSTLVVSVSTVLAVEPRPRDQHRNVAERLVLHHAGLAEEVALAEVVAVIGAQHEHRVVPQVVPIEGVEHLAEPVVDHRQLRAVVGADVARFALGDHAALDGLGRVRRPDDQFVVPVGVVLVRPRRGRVERFVRVELVDEQEEAVVATGVAVEPVRRGLITFGPGKVLLGAEVAARHVVAAHCGARRAGNVGVPIHVGSGTVFHGSPSWPRSYSQALKSTW